MCADMEAAHVYHHTFDAKSGAGLRVTRLGFTVNRLQRFAQVCPPSAFL